MGLIQRNEIRTKTKLGIWHITESIPDLKKMKVLPAGALSILETFTYEKRKKEWLVARILTAELTGEKNVQIIYDEHNKPYLKDSKLHLSISHSHDLLTVIVDKMETGIDIELIKPTVFRIKEKFMSDKELEEVGIEHVDAKLTLYWCVKESLYKYYGKKELTFAENLLVEPFVLAEQGRVIGKIDHSKMKRTFELKYEKLSVSGKDYMLTYIINEH
jgi:4'-phosphopantetheinyl transferase EntD